MRVRVLCSAASPQQKQVPKHPVSQDAHCLNSLHYAMPRVFEANRRTALISDALLPAMFPSSDPEVVHVSQLCARALARQRDMVEAGGRRQAPGRRSLQPTPDTPLAVRGVLLDKFLDDEVVSLVHAMRKHMLRAGNGTCEKIQVVDLACGFSTRPWNLQLSSNVSWFDVDLPSVIQEKVALLEQAGAELHAPPANADLAVPGAAHSHSHSHSEHGGHNGAGGGHRAAVPLRVGVYKPVVTLMMKGSLEDALKQAGWDPEAPTIWLAFALLYYLDVRAVDLLMRTIAAASSAAPCSAFAGTVMNTGLVELIQETVAAAQQQVGVAQAPGYAQSATVDPEGCGTLDVQDELRRSAGVQLAATSLKFGVRRGGAPLLQRFGWESVEEYTPFDIEAAYNVLSVGIEFPEELVQRMRDKHGHEPMITLAVGRRGF